MIRKVKNVCPKFEDDISYLPKFSEIESLYSYNFDARKFANVLKEKIVIPNGVNIVEGSLKQVKLDEFGFIKDLKLIEYFRGSHLRASMAFINMTISLTVFEYLKEILFF